MQRLFKLACARGLLAAFCCFLFTAQVQGKTKPVKQKLLNTVNLNITQSGLQESHLAVYETEKDSSKNKVLAAILAIPIPFGWLGLHRLYLGANPIIPILYIVTIGGVFGILPFVDMMVLILSKDTKPFFKNSKILMWHQDNT